MAEVKHGDHRPRNHVLATSELRRSKPGRADFAAQARNPITVVLDGVTQNYNLGAIFRLCDAFVVDRLVICGVPVKLHKRKLVQAAAGTQHWGSVGGGQGRGGRYAHGESGRALGCGR